MAVRRVTVPGESAHRKLVLEIFERQAFVCIAFGVCPYCTGRPQDPHELIFRSRGGKVSLTNSVGICRACHGHANSSLGGNRLAFDWQGKAYGQPPRADLLGNVRPIWLGQSSQDEDKRTKTGLKEDKLC